MFEERSLTAELETVRERHAPGALVLDAAGDFETLRPDVAENLGLRAERLDPLSYDPAWVPADAPSVLHRLASDEFTVGMPGDGGVAWTTQTVPPTVIVKPRLAGSPDSFVSFLVAEALVQAGLGLPDHFLGFFRERYPALDRAVPLGPANTYQLAAALYEAYLGTHTRETFAGWEGDLPDLSAAWADAGSRLEPRLAGLTREVATGRTDFAAAAELACGAIKHGIEPPTPFGALDTVAYREHGASYAVTWAEKTFAKLFEDED
jgi:hypothetical protein